MKKAQNKVEPAKPNKNRGLVGVEPIVRAQISIWCKDALYTDGSQHKQWFLSQILRLIEPKTYAYLVEQGCDLGIAP